MSALTEKWRRMAKDLEAMGLDPLSVGAGGALTSCADELEAAERTAVVVDEAMVERAFGEWCDVAEVYDYHVRNGRDAIRAALTAALSRADAEGEG